MMSQLITKLLGRIRENNNDKGLSLAEVLIAIGLSGLLALGCTQLAMASFSSANYTENVAVKTLSTGNISRLITVDMEKSTGFLSASGFPGTKTADMCSTATLSQGDSVKPLLTLFSANGSQIGYEVRLGSNDKTGTLTNGTLWRVTCPTPGVANGDGQALQTNLPSPSDASWNTSIMCAKFPANQPNPTIAGCTQDTVLASMVNNPGIIFSIPATVDGAKVSAGAQVIIAARNAG